ncbi:MAG: hypothetical protein MOB07_06655 [Acidobacteria bacterium]|nr:hypothetical protein [Acidobacteriota bacterium]
MGGAKNPKSAGEKITQISEDLKPIHKAVSELLRKVDDWLPPTEKQIGLKPKNRPAGRETGKRNRRKRHKILWVDNSDLVTVGAKVPEDVKLYWTIEAKRQGLTITYLINKALIDEFGVPDGAIREDE